jgi:site-specific recombinase XerD
MNELRPALQDYLRVRRALGYKLSDAERLLGQFVSYCEQSSISTVTIEAAVAWASLPTGADPSWWAQRLSMVRCFATWLQTLDPATEVPPPDILTGRPRRAVPYLYSDAEVVALMAASRGLRTPLQRCTYDTLVGLLAVTGLRVGEAIRLNRGDVCLDLGLVRILGSKFNKSREVPLHASTVNGLRRYAQHRDRLCPEPDSEAFFLSTSGTRLSPSRVRSTFRQLVRDAGLTPRSVRCRPRIHDLRHTLAVNTLLGFYRDGLDVQARLPLLSTWLGHVKPESTYWYLTAVPELLGLAAHRLEDTFEADQ